MKDFKRNEEECKLLKTTIRIVEIVRRCLQLHALMDKVPNFVLK